MERNNALDNVKGFAILLVMFGHCIVLNGMNVTDPYIYDAIYSVQMPLFMLVSGVLAGESIRKNGHGAGFSKLPVRAVSYLVPFFSWFVAVYLFTHIKSGNLSVRGFAEELRDLLMQTDRGLWFLMTLFIATLFVTLAQFFADKVKHKKLPVFIITGGALYLLLFWQSRTGNTFLSPALTLKYFPFYFVGYLWNAYVRKLLPANPERKWKVTEAVLIGVGLVFFGYMVVTKDLTAPADGLQILAMQMITSFCGTVSLFMICYRCCKKKNILSFVGLYTLEIYVLHFRFARLLGLAEKGLQFYSLSGFVWIMLSFVLMSILTAILVWILRRIPGVSFLLFGKMHLKFHTRRVFPKA